MEIHPTSWKERTMKLIANKVVTSGRLATAFGYTCWGLLWIVLAVWLLRIVFPNEIGIFVALVVAWHGATYLIKAGENYQTAWPARNTQEREIELRSVGKYVPHPREKRRKED
jgi:threonine/homoserine/homoserine lactone efflux protein